MKLNDLPEIGFDRQKNASPHSPTDQAPKRAEVAAIVESHPFSSPRLARAVGRAAFRSSQPGTSTRPRRPPQRARPPPRQPGQPQAPPHANSFDSNDNGFVRPISHPARMAPAMHKSAQSRPIAHNRRKRSEEHT